ncbi:MAG: stage 0 sporulation protein, partial [Lachnospiraceae bacterium]|nr:stage 0 sporulation protein [Lachnospiraceae bacterium]
RLMCCLKNEEETYEELNKKLPNPGDSVTTNDGFKGEVASVNVLRQLVKVVIDEGDEKEIKEYKAEDLKFKPRHRKDRNRDKQEEADLKALEQLEKKDGKSKLNDD